MVDFIAANEVQHLYPMVSFSYVFGLLAAVFVLQEHVTVMQWTGVVVIMLGIFMVAQS